MRTFHRICVYCGSVAGGPRFVSAARSLGRLLAARGIGLVYGGGSIGLMGAIADAVLDAGGEAIGVIPERLLELELGHQRLTALHVTPTMQERKRRMLELSDAAIALPGGFGTLEELFEATTWTQLQFHDKPVGILDVDGFYEALIAHIARAAQEGFVRPVHRELIQVSADPAALLDALATAELPQLDGWLPQVRAGET